MPRVPLSASASLVLGSELQSYGGDLLSGPIYLDLAGTQFPEDEWEDNAVPILSWWLDGYRRLSQGEPGDSVSFYFMEGPFTFSCTREGNDCLRIVGYCGTDPVTPRVVVTMADFLSGLRQAASWLLSMPRPANRREGLEEDYDELEELLAQSRTWSSG